MDNDAIDKAHFIRTVGGERVAGELLPDAPNGETGSGIMAPVCNVVAYLLGPIALLAPYWFSVGLTVLSSESIVFDTSPSALSVASRNISTSSVRSWLPVNSGWAPSFFDGLKFQPALRAVV